MVQFSRLLGATVGLLLLIGSATVGMLVLVRTEARRDEFAICAASGASASRLARGVAIEGCLLAVAGPALSIRIARWISAPAALLSFQGLSMLACSTSGQFLVLRSDCGRGRSRVRRHRVDCGNIRVPCECIRRVAIPHRGDATCKPPVYASSPRLRAGSGCAAADAGRRTACTESGSCTKYSISELR